MADESNNTVATTPRTSTRGRKKRKYTEEASTGADGDEESIENATTTEGISVVDTQQQLPQDGKSSASKRRRKISKQTVIDDKEYSDKGKAINPIQRLREFNCVCCGRHESNGRVYTYKSFFDVYRILFPAFTGEDGDVCRHCYSLGYKYRTWKKLNQFEDPLKFVDSMVAKYLQQKDTEGASPIFSEASPTGIDASDTRGSPGELASDSSANGGESLSKRRKYTRSANKKQGTEEEDEDMPDVATLKSALNQKARARATPLANLAQVFTDNMVEVFLDIRLKVQDNRYQKQKIVREFIPSKCTRTQLFEIVQRYMGVIFPSSRAVIGTYTLASTPASTSAGDLTAIVQNSSSQQSSSHTHQQQVTPQPADTLINGNQTDSTSISKVVQTPEITPPQPLPQQNIPKYVVTEIKLAERDSNGVDLEIDLITDDCFGNHPIRSKSRFVAYVEVQSSDK